MNIKLLRRVQRAILLQPGEFDMNYWVRRTPCGTCGCIAGTTVLLSGVTVEADTVKSYILVNGEPCSIKEFARALLGLNSKQSFWLFYGHGFGYGRLSTLTRFDALASIETVVELGEAFNWEDATERLVVHRRRLICKAVWNCLRVW